MEPLFVDMEYSTDDIVMDNRDPLEVDGLAVVKEEGVETQIDEMEYKSSVSDDDVATLEVDDSDEDEMIEEKTDEDRKKKEEDREGRELKINYDEIDKTDVSDKPTVNNKEINEEMNEDERVVIENTEVDTAVDDSANTNGSEDNQVLEKTKEDEVKIEFPQKECFLCQMVINNNEYFEAKLGRQARLLDNLLKRGDNAVYKQVELITKNRIPRPRGRYDPFRGVIICVGHQLNDDPLLFKMRGAADAQRHNDIEEILGPYHRIDPHPNKEMRRRMCDALGMTMSEVISSFSYRNTRSRRSHSSIPAVVTPTSKDTVAGSQAVVKKKKKYVANEEEESKTVEVPKTTDDERKLAKRSRNLLAKGSTQTTRNSDETIQTSSLANGHSATRRSSPTIEPAGQSIRHLKTDSENGDLNLLNMEAIGRDTSGTGSLTIPRIVDLDNKVENDDLDHRLLLRPSSLRGYEREAAHSVHSHVDLHAAPDVDNFFQPLNTDDSTVASALQLQNPSIVVSATSSTLNPLPPFHRGSGSSGPARSSFPVPPSISLSPSIHGSYSGRIYASPNNASSSSSSSPRPLTSPPLNAGRLPFVSTPEHPQQEQHLFGTPIHAPISTLTTSQSRSMKECGVCRRLQDRTLFVTVHSTAEAEELDRMFGSQVVDTLRRAPSIYVCVDHISDLYENREKIAMAVKSRERITTSNTFTGRGL